MNRLIAAAALAAACAAAPAFAQGSWPAKPVKIVNNFPPGGPSDTIARSVADVLQQQLKQPFVVENRAGASGNIGADAVAKAAADGHTVLFGIDTTFTVNPHIYKGLPFKPADLRPVMVMASSGLLVGVNPSTGFRSLQDLVAAGKARPVTFSSAGSGSPGHLAAEVITDAAGVKITHVPYKGNTPAVTAVLSGEVDAGVLATPGMLPHVKAGKITALAVTSRKRSTLAPEIPTVAEAGLPQLEQEVLYVAMVPAATPEPVVQALQKHLADALARPDVRARLQNLDLFYEGLTGAAASRRMADLSERYGKVIRATGMKVE
ncbi:Bug family tripartite tricarboxylate transporter substrate binding protein [Ramlibacter pallidus]|uniref:Tripartite tricarboxylate transporter substrate binding protein n=1 Tax=Ramlibacter pallidus TaxID=2780087 RepID=A0ABR9S7G8_9BURK|nr:tripartite tricarboxylate transporter substrate binding protein [Ramlibacter pallidus]MBE7369474.1 tripartite tricarboxylate transporter substrate binding protein [Ramlibacter pallidus]